MSTKFEDAARALHEAVVESTKGLSLGSVTCAAAVCAVLEVIRDPDEAMALAISSVLGDHPAMLHANIPISRSFWQAGIDVLLAEARGEK